MLEGFRILGYLFLQSVNSTLELSSSINVKSRLGKGAKQIASIAFARYRNLCF